VFCPRFSLAGPSRGFSHAIIVYTLIGHVNTCIKDFWIYNCGMAGKGRPTRDPSGEASKHFIMRLTDAERADYQRAADRAGVSLSEWVRGCLSRAAKRSTKG
jgi:hypothetical protein